MGSGPYFLGDTQNPIWTQYLSFSQQYSPSQFDSSVPLPWSASIGWAAQSSETDVEQQLAGSSSRATESEEKQRHDKQGEELWLATGSGQQDLSYIAYSNPQDVDSMWRFSVDAHSWERVQMPPTKVSWPSRRTLAAAVAISGGHGGLLFGGLGQPECRYGEQVSSWKCPDLNECTVGLSTLWSWKS